MASLSMEERWHMVLLLLLLMMMMVLLLMLLLVCLDVEFAWRLCSTDRLIGRTAESSEVE